MAWGVAAAGEGEDWEGTVLLNAYDVLAIAAVRATSHVGKVSLCDELVLSTWVEEVHWHVSSHVDKKRVVSGLDSLEMPLVTANNTLQLIRGIGDGWLGIEWAITGDFDHIQNRRVDWLVVEEMTTVTAEPMLC